MKFRHALALVVAFGSAHAALAWNDTGHMVVATIAEQNLTPKAKMQIEWLLKQDDQPKYDNIVTASCWADDIRSEQKQSAPWHYINLHFRTDGKETANQPEKENVVTAITRFTQVLGDSSKQPRERVEALRYLIHFVGDIHQPLHAVARDSDAHPNGDRGGNDFKILAPDIFGSSDHLPQNLHALWDLGVGLFPWTPRPLSEESKATIDKLAISIQAHYPKLSLDNLDATDPMAWAQESADIAKRVTYDLEEGERPSSQYVKKGQDACMKRCAYAGYRLAALLNRILK